MEWNSAALRGGQSRNGAPPRSGQPWTDAEYEQILAAAREGVSAIEEVAARIGRGPQPTLAKARRLLSVAERAAPVDRVLPLIRGHQEDPGYDWQAVTLEEPPPRPVVHPPALTGICGLCSEDLLAIGYAVGVVALVVGDDVVTRVGEELQRRGMFGELIEYRADRLMRGAAAEITWVDATLDARSWAARVFPGQQREQPYWGYDDGYV